MRIKALVDQLVEAGVIKKKFNLNETAKIPNLGKKLMKASKNKTRNNPKFSYFNQEGSNHIVSAPINSRSSICGDISDNLSANDPYQ